MELDNKLGNIIYELNVEPGDCDAIVEQIKQTFIDEGWVKHPLKVAIHTKLRLFDHKGYKEYEQTWTPQTIVARNKLHKSLDAYDKSFVEVELLNEGSDMMTGPEWYARWNKQIKTDLGNEGMLHVVDSSLFELIEKATKRASGVEK